MARRVPEFDAPGQVGGSAEGCASREVGEVESDGEECEDGSQRIERAPEGEVLFLAVDESNQSRDEESAGRVEQVNVEGENVERRVCERGIIRQREENPPADEEAEDAVKDEVVERVFRDAVTFAPFFGEGESDPQRGDEEDDVAGWGEEGAEEGEHG